MENYKDSISLFKQTNFSKTIWWKLKVNISGYQNEKENKLVTEICKNRIFRLLYPNIHQRTHKFSRILVQLYEDGYVCWINLDDKFKDKKIIKIDPGAAFGTGSHPSTYLCLEKMENISFSEKRVLDIGSGSGILSIAARLLGAKEVYAVDNDYLAINSTNSNFQLNFGNSKSLKTYLGSFNEVIFKYQLKKFDFVLCNILAEVIKEMIPNIYNCLRNDAEVVFSGILNSQKDEIIKILIQNNLKLLDVSSKKDWTCISAQKGSYLT